MNYELISNFSHNSTEVLKDILHSRGIIDVDKYMNPSEEDELNPYLLDHIEEAANLYLKHIKNNSKILLIQDADTDGICSAAMVWLYTKDLNKNIKIDFICHEHKAHGLSDLMDKIENEDFNLIIIPDAGSFDIKEHKQLKQEGKDIIVLDHHTANYYSEYAIIVNNQLSKRYSNKSLCGAGIVYKFFMVIDNILNRSGYCKKYMDLCALANVADCMSMKHPETRYYIIEGLKHIYNQGLQAFIDQQSYSLFKDSPNLGYINTAFYIVPLLNAVVRVGTMEEKRMLFETFIEPTKQVPTNKRGATKPTEEVAIEMARRTKNAKSKQDKIKEKAIDLLDMRIHKYNLLENNILIIQVKEEDNIPQELRGLICTQFVNRYNRPCAIVAENEDGYLRGSMRGSDFFAEVPDFRQFLLNSNYVEYVEGHPNAAGCSIHKKYLNNLLEYANKNISSEGLKNIYKVDYVFTDEESPIQLMLSIANGGDLWGNDVTTPKVIFKEISFTSDQLFVMGANKDSSKLFHNGIEFVRFKDSDFVQLMQGTPRGKLTVYGEIRKNEWNGKITPQLLIQAYEITDTTFDF